MEHLIPKLAVWLVSLVDSAGYIGVFLALFAEGAWIPITSEAILLAAGVLVAQGRFSLAGVAAAAALGFTAGAMVPFGLAWRKGPPAVRWLCRLAGIRMGRVGTVQRWLRRYGDLFVIISRLIPVVRALVALPAGLARIRPWKFAVYTLFGYLPWGIAVTWLGTHLGSRWHQVLGWFDALSGGISRALVIAAGAAFLGWLALKLLRRRTASPGGEKPL